MKVFFDARYTRFPNHDGVSRYGAALLSELLKIRRDVTAIISDERQLAMLPDGIPYVILNRPTSIREPFIARALNKYGADVVFSPLQTMGARGKKYRLILTIHDLIYYSYPTPPRGFNPLIRLLWRLYHLSFVPERYLLNRADAVVSVSETTKKDIEAHRLTRRPVAVVPNAAGSAGGQSVAAPDKTLVYMGSFVPYKNVDTLVRALDHLPGYTLHLCSRVSDAERQRLAKLASDPDRLIFENGASDTRYHELLARTSALVTASRFEGFGIPLLEAQINGAPVVCSDIPIFHEVADESALYFNPNRPDELAARIKALEDPMLRAAFIARGRANAGRYSWERSARALSDLIDSVGGQ